eukprot:g1447.t1
MNMTFSFVIALSLHFLHANGASFYNISLKDYPLATTIVGDAYPFAFFPPNKTKAKSFILQLDGGGWCSGNDCSWRTISKNGNVPLQFMQKSKCGGLRLGLGLQKSIFSRNCTTNPTFCEFGYIAVPQCIGDMFTGMRHDPLTAELNLTLKGHVESADQSLPMPVLGFNTTFKTFFRGKNVLYAILDTLIDGNDGNASLSAPFKTAEEILIVGLSSGATTFALQADNVETYLRNRLGEKVKIKFLVDSGYFGDFQNFENKSLVARQFKALYSLANTSGSLSRACLKNQTSDNKWRCQLAPESLNHIQAPIFIVQSIFDAWQTSRSAFLTEIGFNNVRQNFIVNGTNLTKCFKDPRNCSSPVKAQMRTFIQQMNTSLSENNILRRNATGAFVNRCYLHQFLVSAPMWNKVKINGITLQEAITEWWKDDNHSNNHIHIQSSNYGGPDDPFCGQSML